MNKLDNKQCPFDPDQYNIDNDNIAVPVGSFAWALSLVYLGKQVHRTGWNTPIEHMRLAHKSEDGSADDGAAYIEKSDKDGYWSRWIPTQEDLIACD
ncbi:Thoeris anti-defense Tad2 family protein [Xenorhabdus vietnamensis]|uniref:Thoeris anti-defense Tad2 family protein n=1 Tax=Xenorhabdus vietnamensis TaxID=351656 RepID=UPI000A3289DA